MMEKLNDNEFWNIYEQERSKLSYLPDADEDFIALEKVLLIYQTEIAPCDNTGYRGRSGVSVKEIKGGCDDK